MTLKTRKTRSFKIAYAIGDKELDMLFDAVADKFPELEITIGCSDDSRISLSRKELSAFPNSKKRRITSLLISSPWSGKGHFEVRFRPDLFFSSVEYEVAGEDKDVSYISDKVEECISTFKLWYTPLAFANFIFILWVLTFVGFLSILVLAAFFLQNTDSSKQLTETEKTHNSLVAQAMAYGTWIFALAVGFLLNRFKTKLFPVGSFLFGHGIKRFENEKFWRQLIGTVIILPVILGVIGKSLGWF